MIDQFSIIYACVEGMQNYYKSLILIQNGDHNVITLIIVRYFKSA